MAFFIYISSINQLIKTWGRKNGRKIMELSSFISIRVLKQSSFFLITAATVSTPWLGDKTKQFLISSSYKCQNPRHMEEADKVVIGKCPWCEQSERSVILLCYQSPRTLGLSVAITGWSHVDNTSSIHPHIYSQLNHLQLSRPGSL